LAVNNNEENPFLVSKDDNSSRKKYKGYAKADYIIITLTIVITLFGFIFRTWRFIREGTPGAFDGWFYMRHLREVYYNGWMNLGAIARDPPGLTFILVMAEHMLGLPGEPFLWSLYIFPQLICSIQLIVYFVLARRLSQSRTVGLLTMLIMSFIGLIVYRNQNVAPEIIVLGMVPYIVFYLYRFLETNDWRHMILAILTTVTITLVHHLTTLIALAIWHIVLPFDILYRRFKSKTISTKYLLINLGILVGIDAFVVLYWIFGLAGFPLTFISGSLSGLFTGASIGTILIMVFGVLLIGAVCLAILFYNFERKVINIIICVAISVVAVTIFIVAMFFGTSSPDQTIVAGLVTGTPIIVLPPLLAIGLVSIPKADVMRSRAIRGWALSLLICIGVLAIFPSMSAILGRIALYIIGLAVFGAALGMYWILKKVNKRQWKAISLIGLIAATGLTMTYAYPKPEHNWGQQEVFWDAEFSALDYITAGEGLTYPQWIEGQDIVIDCDFRLGAIVEGYGNMQTTFEHESRNASWLTLILLTNATLRNNRLITTSPWQLPGGTDYVFISEIMYRDAYLTGWAIYGEDNSDWSQKYPNIKSVIPLNPYMHRIYDTKISTIFLPFASP
jgi:hypothetical protein